VQATKRLIKQPFRDELEQAVKRENEEFAVRVRSDEAKAVFKAFFAKRQPASVPKDTAA
jgi:enoyl-CoA hydratase/carnithine racemase